MLWRTVIVGPDLRPNLNNLLPWKNFVEIPGKQLYLSGPILSLIVIQNVVCCYCNKCEGIFMKVCLSKSFETNRQRANRFMLARS